MRLPAAFLASPRWWGGRDADWLAALPVAVAEQHGRWGLVVDGEPAHGTHALVVPVRRAGEPLVLRMSPPGPELTGLVAALRFWAGRGTVALHEADEARGALLLERLSLRRSARDLPVAEAMTVLGAALRRLAVPAPPSAPSTSALVTARSAEFEPDWYRLGQPFPRALLDRATALAPQLAAAPDDLAVNGDLHSEQVLAAVREPWLTVDPVLLRGDPGYDLARALWTRLDELPSAGSIRHCLRLLVDAAELDQERAASWVLWRGVDYWLWGLGAGLTEDPVRCARLIAALDP